MIETDFLPLPLATLPEAGFTEAEAPSNIALIKYWGKHGTQLPKNPSISFTLDACNTRTKLYYTKKEAGKPEFDFKVFLDGEHKPQFEPKIAQFFELIQDYVPFVKEYSFKIETSNTFPHGSGIASSASGMCALAYCLVQLEAEVSQEMSVEMIEQKTSFLARLGSGSACRSVRGPMMVWGKSESVEGSDDLYGKVFSDELHPVFENFQDIILLVDQGEKPVSSTVGHNLMNNHPFAAGRFEQAHENMREMIRILKEGDLEGFVKLTENEALTLHAMMMTSDPYFILMKPNTLKIIDAIWEFRRKTGVPACFTLDAGANVHLLFPEREKDKVLEFVKTNVVAYCQQGRYICDSVGSGVKKP